MKTLTLNGTNISTYGVHVTATNMFDSPEKNIETLEVPYRNSPLHIDYGTYKPFMMKAVCVMADITQLDSFRQFINTQSGLIKIVDSERPNEFRMGIYKGAFELDKTDFEKLASFVLNFECKPQRFLTSGETKQTFTANGTITNPTLQEAKPLIRIYGNTTSVINGTSIAIVSNSNNYTDIDCETMQCYRGSENRNAYVSFGTGDFPVLKAGANTITKGGATSIEITPRWWQL